MGDENHCRESDGPPRGLGRALEEPQAAVRGGRAAAWTAHPAEVVRAWPLSQTCVREAAGGLWVALCVRCAHPRAVRGVRVYISVWAPFAPRAGFSAVPAQTQAPGFRLSLQVAGAGAGCAGWLEDLPEPREEAPQVFFGPLHSRRATRSKGLACGPWHLWLSGRHRIDWGVVVTRMQGDCPLGKVHG